MLILPQLSTTTTTISQYLNMLILYIILIILTLCSSNANPGCLRPSCSSSQKLNHNSQSSSNINEEDSVLVHSKQKSLASKLSLLHTDKDTNDAKLDHLCHDSTTEKRPYHFKMFDDNGLVHCWYVNEKKMEFTFFVLRDIQGNLTHNVRSWDSFY